MTSFSLTQVVDSPTHFSPSGQPSCINLVLVSNLNFLSTCSVIPQLANSDHLGLLVNLKHHSTSSIPPYRHCAWRYHHADFEQANNLLCDVELEEMLDPSNIHSN